ncbi:MAG TPA: gamma-glutamyl-gamma-aminobutyrate hydrolase family protein [Kofleriaceae bacterium]|nr:gamma-glutamyl-gamma-aminobutyrate hydrolase family protein [Kofleriaceae bacterium]
MRRIGITQRVEIAAGHGERRDCLDQRWARLLASRGFIPVPLCNEVEDVAHYVEALALHGVILTGGNDITSLDGATDPAPERDRFERALLAAGSARRLPILGVCRGAQLLALFHGGRVSPVTDHVARRHAVTLVGGHLTSAAGRVALRWPARFEVNSYHSFTISPGALDARLVPLALADDGSVEAVGHVDLPQLGVLWHPEREDPAADDPLDLLRIFVEPTPRRFMLRGGSSGELRGIRAFDLSEPIHPCERSERAGRGKRG